MHVREVTEDELKLELVEVLGGIEHQTSFHRKGAISVHDAKEEAKRTVLGQAKEMGAQLVVFEPHLELPEGGEDWTLTLSARAYRYANEM